ncbi:MAG: MarR family transcriptional regulator [Methanobrevibacter sp.]|jgi:predicted transcriptional regulator|nr:MarR family transcriptional regulator [Candidatus Methanoflexus mossambicus]
MEEKIVYATTYIKSSKNRFNLVGILENGMKTPSEIANLTNLRLSQISFLLKGLKTEKIVECINENAKRGRLYKLTDLGKKTVQFIEEN